MTKIKICGIKRKEDINYINKYLPDYIGFVFAKSKRQVLIDEAAQLSQNLDTRIKKVGVFVNSSIEEVSVFCEKCTLNVVQLHGDEPQSYVNELKLRLPEDTNIWKAFKIIDENTIKKINGFNADAFLLDTYIPGIDGGAGKIFDWSYAVNVAKTYNVVLAGGLDSENVTEAIELVNPMAVDVSSGVETLGVKDEEKIKNFIEKVRRG